MKRTFLFSAIAAAIMASCGGKVIVDGLGPNGPEGTGGAGGATSSSSSSSSHSSSNVVVGTTATAASTGTTGPGTTSTGAGVPCDINYKCAEAITPPNGDPQLLCPGSLSDNLYEALLKCTCGGPCAAACSASACIGKDPSPPCGACLQDPVKGCGKELQACANDL